MGDSLAKKLREANLASSDSDRLTQVLAKLKSRQKPHQHTWFTPAGSTVQFCAKSVPDGRCPARRPVEESING